METNANQAFWQYSAEQAMAGTGSSLSGISQQQAGDRLDTYGPNTLKAKIDTAGLVLFLRQFKTPVTLLLIGAAILSLLLGDRTDSLIIFVIVLVSGALGFWQERGAANAVKELNKLIRVKCTVLRDGQAVETDIEKIVRGDVILLSAGNLVPADCLLLNCSALFTDEAAFTGETFPVEKQLGVLPEAIPLSKRTNSIFMGSHVISGKGSALVMHTGHQTLLGNISSSLMARPPETEFEHGIAQFGYLLMRITLLLVLIIFAINVYLHKPVLNAFLFSLALAVGLTPQLLPVIISVNLAKGAKKMAAKKVIVKKLSSISNFGSLEILCSDKTGTLTEGRVTIKDTLDCTGNPSEQALLYAWLNATKQQGFRNPIDDALAILRPGNDQSYTVLSEIPYDFIRKRLTVQVAGDKENTMITKGTFHRVLDICDFAIMPNGTTVPIETMKPPLEAIFQRYTEMGFRILGIATKALAAGQVCNKTDEAGMSFLGFVVLFDPPKKEIFSTITDLNKLGIAFKVITGDNSLVAINLLKQIGIPNPVMLTGEMIRNMTTDALAHQAILTDVFAEVEPNQKERIIHVLKASGHVTGFMGDGINDASALHVADVGISVESAVDVAKEAADIILLERDLGVLAAGIREGRITFANTMKYVFMATSANFGNMFSMAGASLFLPFLPLLPTQILLTNLLTDFPEMTIASDRVDAVSIIRPRKWNIEFIKHFMIVFGLLSSVFDYGTFGVLLLILKANEPTFQTGWFTESVISAAIIVLVVRTRLPFYKSPPGKPLLFTTIAVIIAVLVLPYTALARPFGFVKLPLAAYGWMALIVLAYLVSAELLKKWFYRAYGTSFNS